MTRNPGICRRTPGDRTRQMDERTRRTDDELAPNLRRTVPDPVTRSRSRSKGRIAVGLILVLLVAAGIYETVQWLRAPQPSGGRFQPTGAQSVGAATAALGDIRE